MSTAIKLKRSTTQGSTPTTANLAEGELALNVYDGKLFFKKNVSGTESIVSLETYSADSPLPTLKGGLGQSFTPGTGQVPIGNADGSFTLNRILAGTGMQVVSGDGSITVSYTGENTTSAAFAPQATTDLGFVYESSSSQDDEDLGLVSDTTTLRYDLGSLQLDGIVSLSNIDQSVKADYIGYSIIFGF
jgi:hypothetical protein